MSSVWGNNIKISIFGESHGAAIGVVLDGLPSGLHYDEEFVLAQMARRAPSGKAGSTHRREADAPVIQSGLYQGYTTGTPLCALIQNTNTHSADYANLKDLPRPGHADYTGWLRYHGFNDPRGGGHFSGRLTAPLVFAGAVCALALKEQGIHIGAHIQELAGIEDNSFDPVATDESVLRLSKNFPTLSKEAGERMKEKIAKATTALDSLGGVVECMALGLPGGLGSPMFASVESVLSSLLFSIPAVKGVEFGAGFGVARMTGSQCNDPFYMDEGVIKTKTNNNGGILGGITSGMPVLFRVAIKPTASIYLEQDTVDLSTMQDAKLAIKGRHDSCIVPRAVPVVEAATAIGLLDILLGNH